MKTLNYNSWGLDHAIQFRFSKYVENDNLYVGMVSLDGEYGPEPYTDVTVNLSEPCKANCAFIDTNNNPGIINWLIENNLGTLTGRIGFSGFCVYHELEFDMEKMREYEFKYEEV